MDVSHIIEGKRVSLDVEYTEGVTVRISCLPREQVAGMIRRCTSVTFDRKTRQREEKLDGALFGEELAAESIESWEGFTCDGEPLPCTEENKRRMVRNSAKFARWFSDTYAEIEDLIEQEKEVVRKN